MRRATKTRCFSFPDAIWRRFWSPRRAIRLSRALFLASRCTLWDPPGTPGASRGRHETLPRRRRNVLGRHGVPREVPRIDFRSSAWRRPHRFTNSLISCLYCSSDILLALLALTPSHPAHPACPAWPACPANPSCPSHEFCPIQDNLNSQRLPFQTILHDF